MRPRIVLRTHYQADEPRAIIATVTHCSSPTESRHEDAVASALVRWAQSNNYTLSTPGAVYAVGNARSLGLLNASHRWTATGLAFGYTNRTSRTLAGTDVLALTAAEGRLYLRCYLENGGALLIKFGHWLLGRGATTDEQLRSESVIEHLLIEALDEYLTIATDVRDRTAIRKERERLSRSDYASSTKRHKRYPLLTTMERLGLLAFDEVSEQRTGVSPDAEQRLARLLEALPNVTALERACKDGVLEGVIDDVLHDAVQAGPPQSAKAAPLMAEAYRFAVDLGLQACPLSYLDDLLFAYSVAGPFGPAKRVNAEALFEPLHRRFPADVRFHVDRRGRRAFVLIGGEPSKTLEQQLSNTPATSSSSASS